jgi:hypothetical protein
MHAMIEGNINYNIIVTCSASGDVVRIVNWFYFNLH